MVSRPPDVIGRIDLLRLDVTTREGNPREQCCSARECVTVWSAELSPISPRLSVDAFRLGT